MLNSPERYHGRYKFEEVHHCDGELLPVPPIQVREFVPLALPISVLAASMHGMIWLYRGCVRCAGQKASVRQERLFCLLPWLPRVTCHHGCTDARLCRWRFGLRGFDAKIESGLLPKFGGRFAIFTFAAMDRGLLCCHISFR